MLEKPGYVSGCCRLRGGTGHPETGTLTELRCQLGTPFSRVFRHGLHSSRQDWGQQVSRRLANVTLDNLDDLPRRCRRCVFWELDPVNGNRAVEAGDPGLEKEAWISSTLLEW